MPPLIPHFIDDYTDLSQKIENQLFVSGTTNYYAVNLETSLYAVDFDSLFNWTFYNESFEEVNFPKTSHPLYRNHYNVYDVNEGNYILGISSNADIITLYDFHIFSLSNYESLVDLDNPIKANEGSFDLHIEGLYDFVLIDFESLEGGYLEVTYNSEKPFHFMEYEEGNFSFNPYNSNNQSNQYLALNKGLTKILFWANYEVITTLEFTVFGVTYEDGMELSEKYQDDFIVSKPSIHPVYNFSVPFDGNITFEMELNFMHKVPNSSITLQIRKENNHDIYSSVEMRDGVAIAYLKEGNYTLRIMAGYSLKIKRAVSIPDDMGMEEINLSYANSSYDLQNSNSSSYFKLFNHYPGLNKIISFSLEKEEYVYPIVSFGEFVLKNELGERLNLYGKTSTLHKLNPGKYYLHFPENTTNMIRKIGAKVLILKDPNILNDDYSIDNIGNIVLNEQFIVSDDYYGDDDYLKFVLTEEKEITIVSTKRLAFSIYDSNLKLISSYSDYNKKLTLNPGEYVLKISHGIFYNNNIGSTTSIILEVS